MSVRADRARGCARKNVGTCLAAVVALTLLTGTSRAQGTGRSLDIDLSIRSAGMGGASDAVFWDRDPNPWANPALLGYHRGVTYMWGRTRLVPGLADDVFLESERYTLGFMGVGLEFAGRGPGKIRLDYGASAGTDPSGNPTGTFNSYEKIDAWGGGASLSGLLSGWAALHGRPAPALARRADVAFGFASKDIVIDLAPGSSSGSAEANGKDWGMFLRGTPVLPDPAWALPVQVDLAYAYSVINYNDERVTFINVSQPSPLTRSNRNGIAGRVALGIPSDLRHGTGRSLRWLLDSLDPMLSIGFARDWAHNSAGGVASFYDVDHTGLEVTFVNVFTMRTGHWTDRVGEIDGSTSGWGLGFRIARVAGFRYDHATVPQARNSGLDDVERKGFTLFLDVMPLLEHGGTRAY